MVAAESSPHVYVPLPSTRDNYLTSDVTNEAGSASYATGSVTAESSIRPTIPITTASFSLNFDSSRASAAVHMAGSESPVNLAPYSSCSSISGQQEPSNNHACGSDRSLQNTSSLVNGQRYIPFTHAQSEDLHRLVDESTHQCELLSSEGIETIRAPEMDRKLSFEG